MTFHGPTRFAAARRRRSPRQAIKKLKGVAGRWDGHLGVRKGGLTPRIDDGLPSKLEASDF